MKPLPLIASLLLLSTAAQAKEMRAYADVIRCGAPNSFGRGSGTFIMGAYETTTDEHGTLMISKRVLNNQRVRIDARFLSADGTVNLAGGLNVLGTSESAHAVSGACSDQSDIGKFVLTISYR